jgi:hypothetical protein
LEFGSPSAYENSFLSLKTPILFHTANPLFREIILHRVVGRLNMAHVDRVAVTAAGIPSFNVRGLLNPP